MAPTLMDVLESHHSDSWGWALACNSWQDTLAEEVLQEAYLRVLDGRARFAGSATPRTWFFGVIRRVSAELRRSNARQGWLGFRAAPAANDSIEDDPSFRCVDLDESNRQLRVALQAVSQRQREVLHLVFYAELTLEETAQTLGMTLGSARTHYHRGKARLAALLELNHG